MAITKAADNLVTSLRSGESLAVADTLSALVDGLVLMRNTTQELRRFALAFIHSHSGATGVF